MDTMAERGISSVEVKLCDDPKPYLQDLQSILIAHKDRLSPFYSVADTIQYIADGMLTLWLGYENGHLGMYAITEINISSICKAVNVVGAFGKNVDLYFDKFFHGVEQYARMIEADMVIIDGREGWKRLLKPYGYDLYQVRLMKKV